MDELERLFDGVTSRTEPRGAERAWAHALAVLERDGRVQAIRAVEPEARPEAVPVIDGVIGTASPRRGPRLLAVAATIALVATGAAVRWSSMQRGTGTSVVTTSSDGSVPISPAEAATAASAPSTTATTETTTASPSSTRNTTPGATSTAAIPTTSRIGVFGDSPALLLGYGLDTWAKGRAVTISTEGTRLGCGLVRFDLVRIAQYGEGPDNPECDWTTRWPAVLDAHPLDLAVVYSGAFDLADMTFDGDPTWHHVGDPVGDAHLRAAVDEVIALFRGRGIRLALVLAPHIDFGRADPVPPTTPYPISDPTRVDHFNQVLREAAANPGVVLVDLPAELARAFPGGEMDPTARPDGVHLSKEGTITLSHAGLGDELVNLAGGRVDQFVLDAPMIGFFGDSTALMTGIGAQEWGFDNLAANVIGNARLGCGLLATGSVELPDLNGALSRQPVQDGCAFDELWPTFLRSHASLSLAVIQFGPWDVADHQLSGDGLWRHVGDPVFDQALRDRIAAAMETFTSRGIPVVWLAAPHVSFARWRQPPVDVDYPLDDPARIDRFNELVREVAADHPTVQVLDLPGYLAQLPGGEMAVDVRPDGVHFVPESAVKIATDWLGPELLLHRRP